MILLSRVLFISIFIIWHLASIIYIDSLGSLRQSLPQNIIGWLAMVIIISIIALTIFYRKIKIIITAPAICYFISVVTLAINLIYSENDITFWYWSGIVVGALFYIAGLQVKDRWSVQFFCIYCYIIFSGVQALLTAYQYLFEPGIFYLASGMRSNGLSQQINVLSVNMATACLFSLSTLVLSQFALKSKQHEKIRVISLGILIFIFTITIVVLQSITTWLSFIVTSFIFLCLFYQKNKTRLISSYFIIITALFIGVYLIKLCPQSIDTETINQFHLKQMLRFSITLFLEQPYDAWGQSILQRDNYERIAIPFFSTKSYIVPHSHNDILLWLMTGSYIKLISMSLLLTAGIYITFQSILKYKINGNGYSIAIILAITPIIIHNIVEYPFLLSVLHWGIVILFLSFSDTAYILKKQSCLYINKQLSSLFSLIFILMGLSIFAIGAFLFNGEQSFYATNEKNSKIINKITDVNDEIQLTECIQLPDKLDYTGYINKLDTTRNKA